MAKNKAVKAKTSRGSVRVAEPSAKRRLPRLVALVACDGLAEDPNSGKTTIYGVFDRLVFGDTNSPSRPFIIWAKIQGGIGEYTLGISLRYPDGEVAKIELPPHSIVFAETTSIETGGPVRFKYHKDGYCDVLISASDEPIGAPLRLTIVSQPQ